MNIKYFLAAIMLFISIFSKAEDDSKDDKKFWLGPKFGLDATTTTNSLSSLTDKLQQNFQVGMFLQLGKKIYFQPEIYYTSYTTNAATNSKINFVKLPLMLGWQLFDIGFVSLHLNAGPTYMKKLDSTDKAMINLEAGAGLNLLGFITTDLRYTFQKGSTNGFTQVEQLITNGGMVNLTVGLRL